VLFKLKECSPLTAFWQTDTVITHPDVVFYDFYEAWSSPILEDKQKYLGMVLTLSSHTSRD